MGTVGEDGRCTRGGWGDEEVRVRLRTGPVGVSAAAVVSLCLGLAGRGAGAAGRAERLVASPEPVPAEVIAEGTVYFPEGTFHWRSFETELEAGGEPSQGPEPFSIVVVTDGILAVGEGPSIPVPAGGALMIEQEPRPWLSSTDGAAYRTLQIFDEANSEPTNATGGPFTVEGAPHAAQLLQAVLADGEQTMIAATGVPILVLAIDGAVEVVSDADPSELDAGDSDTFDGELTITAVSDPATVVAAVLTPPGGAPGGGTPTGEPAPGEGGRPETIELSIGIEAPSAAPGGSTIDVTVTIQPTGFSGVRSELTVSGVPTDFSADRDPDCNFEERRDVALAADEPTIETFEVSLSDAPDGGSCTIGASSGSQFVTGAATDFIVTITGE